MKLILDIQENNRVPFFLEMLEGLEYVKVQKQVKDKKKSKAVSDLAAAFEDVKLYEEGKKKLKTARDLINEL